MSVIPIRQGDASPGLLLQSMQTIEQELEVMKNDWARAEEDLVRATVAVQRLAGPERLRVKKAPPAGVSKPTKEDLDAIVLEWLWDKHEEKMERQLAAEASCVGYRTVFRCADKALSSKQSRLKADLAVEPRVGRPQ